MRIAVVTNAYPPDARGGAGEVAARLVSLWRASGHEVCIWHERASWLDRSLIIRWMGHLVDAFFINEKIVRSIQVFKPDVVISHNLTGVGLCTPRQAAKTSDASWVHLLHDVQLFEPSGQANHEEITFLQRLATAYRRLFWRDPDILISPTQWLVDAHRQRGWFSGTETRVMLNPLPWQINNASVYPASHYLFVGRWSEDKGATLLAALSQELPYPLVAIGPGTECLASKNIHGKGALSHEELRTWFCCARAVLVPSHIVENQPNVILEAFSAGVPVVASALGGISETVKDAGVLCSPHDVSAWQQAIAGLEEHADLYRARARERAQDFTVERISRAWEALFQEIERK